MYPFFERYSSKIIMVAKQGSVLHTTYLTYKLARSAIILFIELSNHLVVYLLAYLFINTITERTHKSI